MLPVKNRYDEIFEVEVDGWCYGLSQFQGEIQPAIVFRVVGELAVSFHAAVSNNVIFDVIDVATRLSKAAKYLVHEKEITFAILAQLPSPSLLNDEGKFVLAQVVDQIEQAYGGALERLQKKWIWEKQKAEQKEKDREKQKAA